MMRTLKQWLPGLMLVAAAAVAGGIATLWHLDQWGLTPARAAQRTGYCQDAPLVKVDRLTTNTAIALCQGLPAPFNGGYGVMKRQPWGLWWATPEGASVIFQVPESASAPPLVAYVHYGPLQQTGMPLLLWGQVRSPDITAVTATLSNGQTLRDEVVNGLFSFVVPTPTLGLAVEELQVMGQDNQILQRLPIRAGDR